MQYQTYEAAELALEQGGNIAIANRQVRVERARVHREWPSSSCHDVVQFHADHVPGSVYVSRRDGQEFTSVNVDETLTILCQWGEIEASSQPEPLEQEMYGLPSGLYVRFKLFGSFQLACKVRSAHWYPVE